MPLSPGTRLGPYEIVAPLGAGGMGEVYRAKDARLGRDVAIKVLPEDFAREPERLARFEREARLLAALDHPNIARIYGLEELAGTRGLVLELAEGEDLSERIARGALPVDEAIGIALQIARALEHAHERGIVHRDLKPANIKLGRDGVVKVLDFGLARAFEGDSAGEDVRVSQSPTVTHNRTVAGVILGTAAYMSPEQARGRAVDRRADIWSFGVVFCELLTGRQVFQGESVSEILAAVIKDRPDFDSLPANLPANVRRIVERCLTQDPAERLRDIGEARIVLAAPDLDSSEPVRNARTSRLRLAPAAAVLFAVVATAAVLLALRPGPPAGPARRFRVPVAGLTQTFFTPLALTRDGRSLAYEANDRIWIRRLDRSEAIEVPGSAKGRAPFWSWDQQTVCFSAGKKLWGFASGSDQPREICALPGSGEIVGGAWDADGRIVLAGWRDGLYEVQASGGEVRLALAADSTTVDYHAPFILPDGRTILLYVHDKGNEGAVGIVEGRPSRLKRIHDAAAWACVIYSPSGHLIATVDRRRGGEVWAVPFSLSTRKATGAGFRVMDGAAFAAGSFEGLMVAYLDSPAPMRRLVWRWRDGSGEQAIGEPQQGLSNPSLSPDGGRVAYVALHEGNSEIWVQDLVRGTRTRITSSLAQESHPAWSPDGTRLFYSSAEGVGLVSIVTVASDGAGSPDTVAHGYQPEVSPDGRSLLFTVDRKGSGDLWYLPLDPKGAAKPLLDTPADESAPSFAPDGRWIAYASDESGHNEIYIRRFPEGDNRAQVSVNGGSWPRWTPRGDGIYYARNDTLVLVPVGSGPRPALGMPRVMFSTSTPEFELSASMVAGFPVDAHHDGARFLCVQQTAPTEPPSLLFVENWFEEFRKR